MSGCRLELMPPKSGSQPQTAKGNFRTYFDCSSEPTTLNIGHQPKTAAGHSEEFQEAKKGHPARYSLLTLNAMPVSLPLSSGRTLPTALAAPVELGMMLAAALRPPLQSLPEGPSTVFWVAVVECTVVMRASSMPKASCTTCGQKLKVGD